MSKTGGPEAVVKEIRRKTRRQYSAEEKVRTVLEGLRGKQSISEPCRRERSKPCGAGSAKTGD